MFNERLACPLSSQGLKFLFKAVTIEEMDKEAQVDSFTERVKQFIKAIPRGKVATYGQIAMMAGNPTGVRGVVWILHSSSQKAGLPWHRVINRKGEISLPPGQGCEEQKARLEAEGVQFDREDCIDLDRFLWRPGEKKEVEKIRS
jgi:methylated-DNA-protein-cysteine methyltransferase-like protein